MPPRKNGARIRLRPKTGAAHWEKYVIRMRDRCPRDRLLTRMPPLPTFTSLHGHRATALACPGPAPCVWRGSIAFAAVISPGRTLCPN